MARTQEPPTDAPTPPEEPQLAPDQPEELAANEPEQPSQEPELTPVEPEPPADEIVAEVAGGKIEPSSDADASLPVATESRSQRRRAILLALLAALALLLVAFSAWYLIVRKPISELPLPLPANVQMPAYGYSLYGPVHPTGIAVAPDGSRIYATQTDTDAAVFVFDANQHQVATIRPPDAQIGHVFAYVALDPRTGEVYVSDRMAAAIYIYSADGEYLRTFPVPDSLAGWAPLGLSFGGDGRMFVTDANLGVVQEFDPSGAFTRTIGTSGQYSFPNSVAQDAAGRLYVADSNHGRLVILDASGAQIGVIRRGAGEGDLGLPRGTAIDDLQRLYVADSMGQAIKVYRTAGDPTAPPEFVGHFGDEAATDGAMAYPNAVATDSRGRIYIADWANDRIQVWTY